jgi:HemY protein
LRRHWQSVPADARHHPQLAHEAASRLIAVGASTDAQSVIEDALDEQWDSRLAALYGDCAEGDALGLCRYQHLWGKAESYLEASLSQQPTRAAHTELAQLFDHLQRSDAANRHYRAAAAL